MKEITIFTLSDYAQNTDGKWIIVGTFNKITSSAIPFEFTSGFSVAIRVTANESIDEDFVFSIKTPSGKDFISPLIQKCQIKPSVKNKQECNFDFCVTFKNPKFDEEGGYILMFSVGDLQKSVTLYIEEKK